MALVQNDLLVLAQTNVSATPFQRGVVITAGANPVISWEGRQSVTYTGLAAPAGVLKVIGASLLNVTTYLFRKVTPAVNTANANGSGVGLVIDVVSLSGLAVDAFVDNLFVRTVEGLYIFAPPAAYVLLPNQ